MLFVRMWRAAVVDKKCCYNWRRGLFDLIDRGMELDQTSRPPRNRIRSCHRLINKCTKSTAFSVITQNKKPLRRSRSLMVIDFGTNWKPMRRTVRIKWTYLTPFQSYCRLIVKFSLSTGGIAPLNTSVRCDALNTRLWNLVLGNSKHH